MAKVLIAARAKGILKDLKSDKFVKLMYFLHDYLEILGNLSRLFQGEQVLIIDVLPSLEKTMIDLQSLLKDGEHTHLKKFLSKYESGDFPVQLSNVNQANMQVLFERLVDSAIEYMDSRVSAMQKAPLSLFRVFDYTAWPYSSEKLSSYGNEELQELVKWFQELFTPEQRIHIVKEWLLLKLRLSKLRTSCPLDVYTDLLRTPPTNPSVCDLQNILHLVKMMMCVSVSTASPERGFSHTKTALRTQLEQQAMNSLLTITIDGPDIQEFNPEQSVLHWLDSAVGSRHINSLV